MAVSEKKAAQVAAKDLRDRCTELERRGRRQHSLARRRQQQRSGAYSRNYTTRRARLPETGDRRLIVACGMVT
jgi:hypothetical protein